MFESLEMAEQRCRDIDEKQRLDEEKEELRVNEKAYNELEELDKKIDELTTIVKSLSIEKKQKNLIHNKCRSNKQLKLNENYKLLEKLNKEGLVKNNDINLDLNISDKLKNMKFDKNNTNKIVSQNKCRNKPNKDYINITKNKNKIESKCYGCKVDKIVDNYPYIINDFK